MGFSLVIADRDGNDSVTSAMETIRGAPVAGFEVRHVPDTPKYNGDAKLMRLYHVNRMMSMPLSATLQNGIRRCRAHNRLLRWKRGGYCNGKVTAIIR